jgi:hypothetical protein
MTEAHEMNIFAKAIDYHHNDVLGFTMKSMLMSMNGA